MKLFGGSASVPTLGDEGSPRARWDEAAPQGDTRPRSSARTSTINYHANDSVQSLTPVCTRQAGTGALCSCSPKFDAYLKADLRRETLPLGP